jgi:hypothetical protein
MRKGFASLAIVGITACVALYQLTQFRSTAELYSDNVINAKDSTFVNYLAKHGKSYGTKEEFAFRAAIFKRNMDLIA